MSVKFLFFPDAKLPDTITFERQTQMVTAGSCAVGAICGLFGAGGGMMFVILLTCLLGYDIKTSLGTSLIIMTLVALLGASCILPWQKASTGRCLSYARFPPLQEQRPAAVFANYASVKLLNIIMGIVFLILCASLIVAEYIM